jgi:hypothetical protein
MNIDKYLILLAAMSVIMFCGCAESRLDREFGNSYRLAKFGQIYDLNAGKNLQPVTGLDGTAAAYSYEKYQKSFSTQDKTSQGQAGLLITTPGTAYDSGNNTGGMK